MRRSSLWKVGKNRIFPIFLFSSGTYFLGNAFRIRLTTYKKVVTQIKMREWIYLYKNMSIYDILVVYINTLTDTTLLLVVVAMHSTYYS